MKLDPAKRPLSVGPRLPFRGPSTPKPISHSEKLAAFPRLPCRNWSRNPCGHLCDAGGHDAITGRVASPVAVRTIASLRKVQIDDRDRIRQW